MDFLLNILENNNYELTIEDIEQNKNCIGYTDEYNNTVLIYYLIYNINPKLVIIKLLENEIDMNINIYNNITISSYCTNMNIKKLDLNILKYILNKIDKKNYLNYNRTIKILNSLHSLNKILKNISI